MLLFRTELGLLFKKLHFCFVCLFYFPYKHCTIASHKQSSLNEYKMSNICRLCLSFNTQNMLPLSECDSVVYNSISFPINIPDINLLPNHVCTMCINKLKDFNDFCLQIQKNEEVLLKTLCKGEQSLNHFYEQIKNQTKIESVETNQDYDIKESNNILKQIKTEEDVNSKCGVVANYDSDDELPFSETEDQAKSISIKRSKEKIKKEANIKSVDSEERISDSEKTSGLNYKCLTCFELFAIKNDLLSHYNNIHKGKEEMKENYYTVVETNEKKLYKCNDNDCDKSYNNLRALNKHAKMHRKGNFHCNVCGRIYKTVSEIVRHGRAHSDGMKLSCSFGCGFATVYPGALKGHERRHREEFKYKCETCGKSFQVKTWFEQHQNVHTGAKPYVCAVCGMAFHMDRYLKVHCNSVHPEVDVTAKKRYVCVKCSKPCGSMRALTHHLKEHGVISSSLLCDLCGKTLCSAEQLRLHRRIHSGEKPHTCSTCNKSFTKRSNLAMHMVSHTGARAHPCTLCGKRYSQKSALKRHIHTHHTGNAMKCPKCSVPFVTKLELRAHRKICSS